MTQSFGEVFSRPLPEDTAMGFSTTLQVFQAIFPEEQACGEALRSRGSCWAGCATHYSFFA